MLITSWWAIIGSVFGNFLTIIEESSDPTSNIQHQVNNLLCYLVIICHLIKNQLGCFVYKISITIITHCSDSEIKKSIKIPWSIPHKQYINKAQYFNHKIQCINTEIIEK